WRQYPCAVCRSFRPFWLARPRGRQPARAATPDRPGHGNASWSKPPLGIRKQRVRELSLFELQIFFSEIDSQSVTGHRQLQRPEDGLGRQPAIFGQPPVGVEVQTTEAE